MAGTNRGPDDETLLQRMSRMNPWWRTGTVPNNLHREFKRSDYMTLTGRLDGPEAQSILGARRVGKTTMLYQLAADLLSSGTDPRRILFLALDAQGVPPDSERLMHMLELYARDVLREPISELKERAYAMIDEVHLIKGWQGVAKHFFDQAWPVKFIVSGSSGEDMFTGPSESLVGRIRHQTLAAMSFAEYASFASPPCAEAVAEAGRGMRAGLDESARTGSAGPFHESAERASLALAVHKDGIEARLAEYMQYGGYPGIAACASHGEKVESIRTCLELSLHKDAVRAGGVRSPALLDQLFYDYAWRSPHTVSREKVSRSLGTSRDTVDAYSRILRWAFLVSFAEFYTPRPSVRNRRNRKVYVNDVGIRNVASLLGETDAMDDPAEAGMMAETVAGDHTRRLWQALAPSSAASMPHFWHNGGGAEVDLVIRLRRRPVPIKVKYRRRAEPSDLKGLSQFSDRFDPPVAVAVSRGELGLLGDGIVAVPMWLYLCMC